MASRKQLKNLACGIAGRFVSRNNDLDGYWALGLLYADATASGTREVHLDLFEAVVALSFTNESRLVAVFRHYCEDQLRNIDLERHVRAATIHVSFNVEPEICESLVRTTWGDAFLCEVDITDDLGRRYKATECGYCGIHDPTKERRSTRLFSW